MLFQNWAGLKILCCYGLASYSFVLPGKWENDKNFICTFGWYDESNFRFRVSPIQNMMVSIKNCSSMIDQGRRHHRFMLRPPTRKKGQLYVIGLPQKIFPLISFLPLKVLFVLNSLQMYVILQIFCKKT